jgi:hypothetical protein
MVITHANNLNLNMKTFILRKKKIILYSLLGLLVVCSIAMFWCNNVISNTAKGKLFTSVDDIS